MSISRYFKQTLIAFVCVGFLSACLPDSEDTGADIGRTNVGKLTGSYYAASLSNIAVQAQNFVTTDATWFTASASGQLLDMATLNIDTDISGVNVKTAICPTGVGTSIRQISWLDSKDSAGNFELKAIGSDAGDILATLRQRVAAEQAGTYTSSGALSMADGTSKTLPSSCAGVSIPKGAPVLVFEIDEPAAPTTQLSKVEYRTIACATDVSGRAQKGTQVQSRMVRYNADGTITNGAWTTQNPENCLPDTLVSASTTMLANAGSTVLNNFADVTAQGFKSALEALLKMDCTSATISTDMLVGSTRKSGSKNIDTCITVNMTDAGTQLVDDDTLDKIDTRNACPRDTVFTRALLGLSTGTLHTKLSGVAYIKRNLDNSVLNSSASSVGERNKWYGSTISCSGYETYVAKCNVIPGLPTGAPDVSAVGNKWITDTVSGSSADWGFWDNVFGCWISSCKKLWGINYERLNLSWFNAKKNVSWVSTTARRNLSASSWSDSTNYFVPNFNLNALLNWTVPSSTNQCRVDVRELQTLCPYHYNSSKQGSWSITELGTSIAKSGAFNNYWHITLKPGGCYGGDEGAMYARFVEPRNKLNNRAISTLRVTWKKCDIKGCKKTTNSVGPGRNVYILSKTYLDSASIGGGQVKVQTIMMNKDGQLKKYIPTIVSGPKMVFSPTYIRPLKCGRIERKTYSWRKIVTWKDCGAKGCKIKKTNMPLTIERITRREWSGTSSTNGSWSKPNTFYRSEEGQVWSSYASIPNPIPSSYTGLKSPTIQTVSSPTDIMNSCTTSKCNVSCTGSTISIKTSW